jgi:acetyl coenzyme A synthetase (ADP forming)-like protein
MESFFSPKTIALIGASSKKGKIGNDIFNNLKGSKSKIIPVNINKERIGGQNSYAKVNDYSGSIDLAIIVIPARFVSGVLKECGEKGIKSAIIISAGFGEIGKNILSREVFDVCKKYGIKILGPNCLGILNNSNNLNASFYKGRILKGGISFISQSGAIGVAILGKSINEHIGFSKFISVGNMLNTDFSDYIKYLSADKDTKVICIYMEGIKKGESFIKAVKGCKKPIIALKAGFTSTAMKAIASHTGSLAGDSKIYESIFRQFGIIKVDNLNEMFNLAKHLSKNPFPKSKNVCIVTNAGGMGVLCSDACESNGLSVAKLPKIIEKEISKVLPSHWSKSNPIDVLGDALADRYESVLNILSKKNFYGIFLFVLTPQSNTEVEKSMKALINFKPKNPKIAVFSCVVGGENVAKAIKMAEENSIINFIEPYFFAKALSKLF